MLGALAVIAAAVVAAGCGGDDADPTVTWADDLCSTVVTWKSDIAAIVESLASGGVSQDAFTDAAEEAQAATEAALDDLRGLGAPPAGSGEQAEDAVGDLAGELETQAAAIGDAVGGVQGIGDVAEAVSAVSASLAAMGSAVSSTVETLRGVGSGDELRDAFAEAESCDELAG